jgi:hypothetical protein
VNKQNAIAEAAKHAAEASKARGEVWAVWYGGDPTRVRAGPLTEDPGEGWQIVGVALPGPRQGFHYTQGGAA